VKFLLKLLKQERSYLDFVGSSHRKAYRTAELASNFPVVRLAAVLQRIALQIALFLATAFLISACASSSEVMTEQPSSQSAAPVPGEKIPDEETLAPGPGGSGAGVRW
jgi:hypothetical protein